jgi:hypothetical protein
MKKVPEKQRWTGPVPVSLSEPNVLLLDMPDYALDRNAWRPPEEILRLDNALRDELGWPGRGEAVAQPWVDTDNSTPHTLRLRYAFGSEIAASGCALAMENAENAKVVFNGTKITAQKDGWYVDKCIGKIALPPLKKGTNVIEVAYPYGIKTNPEAAFLLGDFGVRVQGTRCTVTPPVRELAFGDITRQGLPFYGGNVTYHLEAASEGGSLTIDATAWRFMLLRVAVDGQDRGVIAFSPYRLVVDGLDDGIHQVDLTGFGCRVNAFGQVHNTMPHEGYWWGPDSWRTVGPAWSYEYKLWPQGVMKSVEI